MPVRASADERHWFDEPVGGFSAAVVWPSCDEVGQKGLARVRPLGTESGGVTRDAHLL